MNVDEWLEYQRARAEAEAAWELLSEEEKAEAEEMLKSLWEMLEADFPQFDFEDDDEIFFEAAMQIEEAEQLLKQLRDS